MLVRSGEVLHTYRRRAGPTAAPPSALDSTAMTSSTSADDRAAEQIADRAGDPADVPADVNGPDEPARPAHRRGWFITEFAALALPVVMPVVRRLPTVVLGLCVLLTTVSVFALVGALRDDAAIASRPVVVTAEVLPGSSWSRTLIRFTTQDGKLLVPEKGVYYPRGLTPGQVIRVEYDRDHPDRVRVFGRDASIGYLPVAGIVLGLWATLGPLWWWLRRRQRRREPSRPESPVPTA